MTKEKILLVGDSLQGPTGFANDLAGICWCLADKYDVHALGLQTPQDQKVKINMEGEQRTVIQHANYPRGKGRFDFGNRSLPVLLDNLEPEILLSVNDIQMVKHVPDIMCPNGIQIPVIDLPSKKFNSDEALINKLKGELTKFKEKFPRDTKWIQYAPQDGDPPMNQWERIYKMSDKVVAMSKYGQWVFKHWFKMDVPWIYHGVDTEIFTNNKKPKQLEDKFIVGNFNRNQPRKQPVRSMIGFAKFAKDKNDVLLHMQMDWNDEFGWPIEYFAQQYGIRHKMINPLPVGIPREKVAEVYNTWDINLNTTGGEGFGLTTIEGAICGLPNVITDYTTSRELVIEGQPGPRGSLIKCHDLHWQKMDVAAVRRSMSDNDDLAKVLNKYYYNRDLLIEHGKAAEEWTKENCSWKVIAKDWHKLVEDVLSGE